MLTPLTPSDEKPPMIVRICKGWTQPDDRDAYARFLVDRGTLVRHYTDH